MVSVYTEGRAACMPMNSKSCTQFLSWGFQRHYYRYEGLIVQAHKPNYSSSLHLCGQPAHAYTGNTILLAQPPTHCENSGITEVSYYTHSFQAGSSNQNSSCQSCVANPLTHWFTCLARDAVFNRHTCGTLGSHILSRLGIWRTFIFYYLKQQCSLPALKHHHRTAAFSHHRLSFELLFSILSGINELQRKTGKVF